MTTTTKRFAGWHVSHDPYPHVKSDHGCELAADYCNDEATALINAAPDLLEALEIVRNWIAEQPVYSTPFAIGREGALMRIDYEITKAKGK